MFSFRIGMMDRTKEKFLFLRKAESDSCLFVSQLQKSKEREERLEEVIQAYEKIHLEKSNVQRDLDKMVSTHTHTHTHKDQCSLVRAFKQKYKVAIFGLCVRRL